jgi:hypothetical protein
MIQKIAGSRLFRPARIFIFRFVLFAISLASGESGRLMIGESRES